MRPLLIAGGLAAAALVAHRIWEQPGVGKSFWPLRLSGAAFFYLWWLAALLFDLSFTWHRYIRHAFWQKYFKDAISGPNSR